MTSSEMPTRIAMPQPFASGASATRATIESVSGDNMNYVDGFPGKYSLPASEGGKYVSRGEMNALGNMASNDLHYFKCGGLNTFDAAFCAAIGGYPKGAVLKYLYNGWLYDVISLKDGNTYDVAENGPDDINWAYLSVPDKKAQEQVFFEGATGVSLGHSIIGVVLAKKSGGLILKTSISPVLGSNSMTYNYDSSRYLDVLVGCSIAIHEMSSVGETLTLPTLSWDTEHTKLTISDSGWKNLSGDYGVYWSPSGNTSLFYPRILNSNLLNVQEGKYYALALFSGDGVATNSDTAGYKIDVVKYASTSGTLKILYST